MPNPPHADSLSLTERLLYLAVLRLLEYIGLSSVRVDPHPLWKARFDGTWSRPVEREMTDHAAAPAPPCYTYALPYRYLCCGIWPRSTKFYNGPSELAVVYVQSRSTWTQQHTLKKEQNTHLLYFTPVHHHPLSDAFLFRPQMNTDRPQFLLSHAWSDMLVKSV